jgi:hypothetical protein
MDAIVEAGETSTQQQDAFKTVHMDLPAIPLTDYGLKNVS